MSIRVYINIYVQNKYEWIYIYVYLISKYIHVSTQY